VPDPQGAIAYLYKRKALYKKAAKRHYIESKNLAKSLKDAQVEKNLKTKEVSYLKKRLKHWKEKSQMELKMKKYWMYGCATATFGLIILTTVIFTVTRIVKVAESDMLSVPTSGKLQRTPDYILASVNIFNGPLQGSGTIISQGSKYSLLVSAAHNFIGNIGVDFWVYYPDGSYTKGQLVAIDKERDLALCRVDADTILANTYVPETLSKGTLTGVGYTGGQGPNLKYLKHINGYYNASHKFMWNLSVTKGPFWDGDSGGGIFINNGLIGVTSKRNSVVWNGNISEKRLYACAHNELITFLKANPQDEIEYGNWNTISVSNVDDSDLPPLWKPNPNVPIYFESKAIQTEHSELKKPSDVEELLELKRPSDVN